MNESILFDRFEKSSTFGKISRYSYKENLLSRNCGELIISLNEHSDLINSIQFDEKSNKLISASNDSTIKIWNLETGECLNTVNTGSFIRSLAIVNFTSEHLIHFEKYRS